MRFQITILVQNALFSLHRCQATCFCRCTIELGALIVQVVEKCQYRGTCDTCGSKRNLNSHLCNVPPLARNSWVTTMLLSCNSVILHCGQCIVHLSCMKECKSGAECPAVSGNYTICTLRASVVLFTTRARGANM